MHLKERRKLILVPRETPLSLVQIDNMRRATEAGAVVLPASPGFYHGAATIGDLVDFIVARICDQLGMPQNLIHRWGEVQKKSRKPAIVIMLPRLRHILEMIRFSHTLFALPFALLAAVMAWNRSARQDPPVAWRWNELVGILICMVGARSAAMAFNRLADQRIDAENPRTAGAAFAERNSESRERRRVRDMLFGSVCRRHAAVLPNRLPLILSLPVLLFLLGYSYAKRFTALAHFWLGAALMLAPISAWIAIRGQAVMQTPADLLPALCLAGRCCCGSPGST